MTMALDGLVQLLLNLSSNRHYEDLHSYTTKQTFVNQKSVQMTGVEPPNEVLKKLPLFDIEL